MTFGSEKIFHLIPSLQLGGAEKALVELLSDPSVREQSSVVVMFGGGALERRLTDLGVPIIDLRATGMLSLFGVVWRLIALIRAERPRILQTWLYYADFLGLLALYLSGRRARTVLAWGIRCSDHRFAEYRFRLRSVIRVCAYLSRLPDVVIYNSHAGRLAHSARGYKPNREAVIENGIDASRFVLSDDVRTATRDMFGWPDTRIVVVMIGRNDEQKGYKIFLKMAERFPEIQAVAVGMGTETLPNKLNLARLGARTDIPQILAAADILVSCSLYGEGFLNVVAEAMAAGRPVICTGVGDAPRIVGEEGIIVSPGSSEGLEKAVVSLIEAPELRRSLGERGRTRILSEFSLSRMTTQYRDLYRDVLVVN